ncbi:Ribosomal RNA large subunit methyltransferase M [Burkholderiales bacterium]|nr:Ribosomal RNA large subunit methyltransferase M [Burkholderiales bacterium]
MTAIALALCRAGFEAEAAADLAAIARTARASIEVDPTRGAAFVVARLPRHDRAAWRRAVTVRPPVFLRSHFTGSGPHLIAVGASTRPDRIAPLVAALAALAASPEHAAPWLAPWIEFADTNEGKALSTLARALDGRLASALRERGLVAGAAARRPHVFLVDGTTSYVGTSEAGTGSTWPLGIPRFALPRAAPSRSALKLAEAITVFLGDRTDALLHMGQAAVDLGAAPGGWTWQLVARGLQVTAVDNGALAPALARDPNVEHVRADGLKWRPRRPVDWLVCDIVEQPVRIASLVADWIATGTARNAIFNLKLPMKRRHDEVERCAALIRDRLDAAGIDATVAFRHLYHDREEVSGCVLRRR